MVFYVSYWPQMRPLMTTDARPAVVRWAVFVWERFPPPIHLPLVLAFGGGNLAVAAQVTGIQPSLKSLVLGLVAASFFFFRLRLFDELKDYETDLTEHPDRPLPRGVVSVREVKKAALFSAVLEGGLATILGWHVLAAWSIAALYSLLMYNEFFCGRWMRPKLELYALVHTLVAGGLGWFLACVGTLKMPWELPSVVLGFALVNWSVFNVFEFARKTYGDDESDGRAETYSGRLGPLGAVALSLFWAVLAVLLTGPFFLNQTAASWIWPTRLILLLPPVLMSMIYLARPRRLVAQVFRALYSAFLFVFYLILILAYFLKGTAQ